MEQPRNSIKEKLLLDQRILCKDCGEYFIHGAREQEWMRSKFGEGYKAPRRCFTCRKKAKYGD